MGVYGKGYLGVSFFYVGRCVLKEWAVRGGGLDGYFSDEAYGCMRNLVRPYNNVDDNQKLSR